MKAANKICRAKKTDESRLAALVAAGWTEKEAEGLLKPNCFGRIGFERFELTNNNATIKSTRDRLERMKAEKAAPTMHGWEFDGGEVVANQEADRLQILFDTRPSADMIAKLKKAAFKWSPRNGTWQRQLTWNAIGAAKRVLA